MDERTPSFADKAFLGVGWNFPVQPRPATLDVEVAIYEEDIRQAIRIILETNPGERVMRPEFGAGLQALVFEPLNITTLALARHRIEESLITWEPRIDHISVNLTSASTQGKLLIEITYRVRTTNTFYNLVYPFHLQEGQP